MNKITLEDEFGIYTIESKNAALKDVGHISYTINLLVRPALLAAGYSIHTIDEYVPEVEID